MSTVRKYMGHIVPAGATHYAEKVGSWAAFYKVDICGEWVCWLAKQDTRWSYGGVPDDMLALPQEPETFVPVVGEECELTPHNAMWGFSNGETVRCTVVGLHLDWIVVVQEHCAPITTRLDKCDLAPVKSEREEIIDMAVFAMNDSIDDSQEGWAMALFDAGMLSLPGDKS